MVNPRNSLLSNVKRLLRFAQRFTQDPKHASSDLARYLSSRFAPFPPARSASTEPASLVADIAHQFHVSETFVRLYREQGDFPLDWSRPSWQDFFESLPPLQKLTVPFALSTVIRGRNMLSFLESQSCIRKKDLYLDIGTGYGGFLRAAKEMGFKEVIGIELHPGLANLARANIDGLPGAQVWVDDFLKRDFATLHGFDLITCNDVIEHVQDPRAAIQKMSSLLNEGGCVSFEVPNKDAIQFVKSDGHFVMFGITQLAREDAAEYYSAHTGAEKSVYFSEMGEMYELDWYLNELRENGLSAFVADTHSIGSLEDVPDLMKELKQTYRQWQTEIKPGLETGLAQRITSSVEKYIENLEHDFADLGTESSTVQFKDRYLRTFWTIIAARG
jgi:2-polyprenyl-3-methyl-5-hydroxy-6-metoxy-1,4-benzoquinol methylase